MITIFKSFVFKKSNINNLIIFSLILLFLFLIVSFYKGIVEKQNDILNTESNRTVVITLKDKYNIVDIKKLGFVQIVSNYANSNDYEIIFKSYTDIKKFEENYSDYYDSILLPTIQIPPIYKVLHLLALIFTIIISILVVIFLIFHIIDFTMSNKDDISFYKLIGYTNSRIIKYLFVIYFFIYFVTCFITFFMGNVIVSIINNILKIKSINFMLLSLNINYLFFEIVIIFDIIFIILCYLYIKIKKISPLVFERRT